MKYEVKFKDEQLVLIISSTYVELVCNALGPLSADQSTYMSYELMKASTDERRKARTGRTIRQKRCFGCRPSSIQSWCRHCSLGPDALGRVYEVDKAVDLLPWICDCSRDGDFCNGRTFETGLVPNVMRPVGWWIKTTAACRWSRRGISAAVRLSRHEFWEPRLAIRLSFGSRE
jgi:hypothetical protein